MIKVIYKVLSNRKYLAIALVSTIALMLLYIVSLSSVVLNSIGILTDKSMLRFISSSSPLQLVLIALLTILFGIWLALQIYLRQKKKTLKTISTITATGGVFSGFLGGLGALGGCPACLIVITAVIGSTATALLLQYRTPIVLLAIGLIIISICATSYSIKNKCRSCK
jgi:hypothetical protein